ncbi:hypothetical protein [Leeuwenhoekiella sp. H156]|uniref:hypothetical protein n=1 Tax=Leeuwenhoekiella sp. H156 TaxID=3450128 RepID=UPI003FA47A21
MKENFEFNDLKSVRKSLLVSCISLLFLTSMKQYYTGMIKLLGFEIPISDVDVIQVFLVLLIVFYLIAFWIRLNDERYQDIKRKLDDPYFGSDSQFYRDFISEAGVLNKMYLEKKDLLSEAEKKKHRIHQKKVKKILKEREILRSKIESYSYKKYTNILDELFPLIFGVVTVTLILFDLFLFQWIHSLIF